jgi:hypothetical protein
MRGKCSCSRDLHRSPLTQVGLCFLEAALLGLSRQQVTKTQAAAQISPYSQNVAVLPNRSIMLRKVSATTMFETHNAMVATLIAEPRTCSVKISDIISHTMGPRLKAKQAT